MKPGWFAHTVTQKDIPMNKLFLIPLLAAAISLPALAQTKPDEHAAHHVATAASAPADMADGEIRKVDSETKKITIKHGEIKNLDMPAMTMVFQVKDPALLDKVKAGDKVRFAAEKNAAGAYVVTDILPAR